MLVLTRGEGSEKIVRQSGVDFWASGSGHTCRTAVNGSLSPISKATGTGKCGNRDLEERCGMHAGFYVHGSSDNARRLRPVSHVIVGEQTIHELIVGGQGLASQTLKTAKPQRPRASHQR